MNQGIFYSDDPILKLGIAATQLGLHKINARTPGGAWVPSSFEVNSLGAFEIPNIFNEQGSFIFEIEQPDGSIFEDGSDCSMSVLIRLRGCSPFGFSSGGSGGTPFYQLITIPAMTDNFTITVNGGNLPSNTDRDLQIYQYPGGNKLLPNVMYSIAGPIVTLDPMVLVPVPMSFEIFFQIID